MGLKPTKEGPPKIENLSLHHHLINYLTKNLYIRNLVSKKRRRMLIAGYDLDMSYITDRLLAMSFPAERMRAMYRNPLWQVKSVLDMRHHEHYKAGKGRTGLMVSSYLVYSGMLTDEALQLYADRRTTNNEGVSIPSQRRYVGYWESMLSVPRGTGNEPINVSLPQTCSRELRRIRLYDTLNVEAIFFVISEMQKVPNQVYCPSVEIIRSSCRQIKKGYQQNYSPCYYLSYVEGDEDGKELRSEEPRVVVQMDTEDPAIYQKSCLDHYFDKPVQLTGDVRVIFYQKLMGSRLFYCCFNTAFVRNGLLQLKMKDLDKVGNKGRSICGPSFCLELLFGPANMKHSATPSTDEDSGDEYP
ncbi:phosphatidylinositol 3,4,5-trisphosphate 3-phosphatase and protein-tyrosine-phosphatase PTEN1 isoform X3 [Prosopis cineraria]|uniref:phosphatidylinositol 3,4,5-trisphosphate 3-phosphatase and protein-tyrosine-phosphatase PTEN1 isoform X3 n=1 Tax=Prosopis cineraria TaxID=364024 RepID=UPI00240FAC0E|nr:phosphatidylinositol 3,4,5-trisphosphate 3-phosphatase and protein-tyrosine-phosphatase PTEN1 isoform X3 [Prosopis cineraria]